MWTDPQDIVFNGKTLAQWKGTRLVRKEGGYPTNEKDGVLVKESTVRNAHSTVAFKDTGVVADKVYYYCLFPYTDKAVTMSDNNRFTGKRVSFDPVLKNNSWAKIAQASEQGIASQLWQIGDEIDLTLSGTYNETVTLQIWDFNHFDKTDGTGKAGICFGMKHLMKYTQQINSTDTNNGGWNATNMKKTVMNNIYNSIPVEIRNAIKEVNTYANSGGSNSSSQACTDKVFLPGFKELGFTYENYDGNQVKFPIFSDNNSRIKKLNNGAGSANYWWTRSPSYSSSDFRRVLADGGWSSFIATVGYGVCFCFNV